MKQENEYIPFEAVKSIGRGKVLVLAPHPDDEVLGCGGAIIRHVYDLDPVKVVVVTDGSHTLSTEYQPGEYAAMRKRESSEAALVLGYGTPEFLGYPDRGLEYSEDLIGHLHTIIREYGPAVIYLPSSSEIHPDHRVLYAAGTEACIRYGQECLVAYYEVAQPLHPDKLLDITDIADLKEKAVDCFVSQLKLQDYKYHIRGLNAFRTYTLPAEVKSAEGYQCIRMARVSLYNGSNNSSLRVVEPKIAETGILEESPLVSIIVRTMNRPELREALDSIARQTYPCLEVIVVDASGKNVLSLGERCGNYPVRIITQNRPLHRQFAANAGLDAVQGSFFCFLDEDDLLQPDHIGTLVKLMLTTSGPAVYSWIEKVDEDGTNRYVFNNPFNFYHLLQENYLPVHALLFRREVLAAGCRFDEALEVFEDWDFLIQVAHLGPFIAFPKVTGTYRNFKSSAIHEEAEFTRKYRMMLLDKWRKRLDPGVYAEFIAWTCAAREPGWGYDNRLARERDEEEIRRLHNTIEDIFRMRSWRYTAPVRRLAEFAVLNRKVLKEHGVKTWSLYAVQYIRKKRAGRLINSLKLPVKADSGIWKTVRHAGKIPQHQEEVDIIICVHNALEDVRKCLSSVIRFTRPPYNLILVDDGSGIDTRQYLSELSESQGFMLLRNDTAVGYTKAANQGMKASSAPFLMLLNSDTLVCEPEWLDRMIFCARRDDKTGIVSPLSNTASWQSVPEIITNDDWSANVLPEGMTLEQMARMVAGATLEVYPEIPFLNGFCLLIRASCLKSVGYFDEESFPFGYGEENDFCMRAIRKKWKLAVAGDVYLWHAQSKSYSHESRHRLSNAAGEKLCAKQGAMAVAEGVEKCRNNLVLKGIRSRVAQFPETFRIQQAYRTKYGGKKLLFVLPVGALGGGANVIMQEIRALRELQVDCHLANILEYRELFERAWPSIDIPVIWYDGPVALSKKLDYFDAVIGTAWYSIDSIRSATRMAKRAIITGYYIQDFEPLFFEDGIPEKQQALDSYTLIPGIRLFTKTHWNSREVYTHTGLQPAVILPSADLGLFRPVWDKNFTGTLKIVAMIRPETPRRSPELTMEVLREIRGTWGSRVEIYTFGCSPAEKIIRQGKKQFRFKHLGILSPEQLSSLFNNTHLFIDMSSFQAMGLTGMEAMACGNAVILPQSGGASSFITHGVNGYLADTSGKADCLKYTGMLINDRNLLFKIASQAIMDICRFSPVYSSANMLDCLFQSRKA